MILDQKNKKTLLHAQSMCDEVSIYITWCSTIRGNKKIIIIRRENKS